jgi:hypothetical protein
MPKSKQMTALVIALCRALIATIGHKQPPYWTSIDSIRRALGVPLDELEAAVIYAVAQGLVQVEGQPATKLAVTPSGTMLSPVLPPAPKRSTRKPSPRM